jgi:hypothetical protein
MGNSKKDASTSMTFRLPASLKAEIARIAKKTDRSLSNTLIWLLKRGIAAYKETGLLVEGKAEGGSGGPFRVVPLIGNGVANEEKEAQSKERRAR